MMYLDLAAFNDSLLCCTQVFMSSKALLIEEDWKLEGIVLSIVERVVSSAYMMKEKSELHAQKSLI